MSVIPHASVEAFFREVVVDALESEDVEATEHTEFYLVGLLGEFTRAAIPDEPMALKLVAAKTSTPSERFRVLKEVGDTTLYLTGFFAESFDRKVIDPDYYMGLGEAAYRELASDLGSSAFQEVYTELAAKFPRFVDVLHHVRDNVSFASADPVRLYEQWVRTKSDWVERRLRAMGLVVADDDTVH